MEWKKGQKYAYIIFEWSLTGSWSKWNALRSINLFNPIFNLCFKPKEEPTRKILTISTLQLNRAINDRIQDEMDQVYIQEPSKESVRSSMPEDFPFDKPRKKFVGGGGVIAKYENPFRYYS